MSNEVKAEPQVLTAEFKDGQLQIVEVTPYEKVQDEQQTSLEEHIVPETIPETSEDGEVQTKYMQVLDPAKGLMQLDLLNLTLVRCEDGEQAYKLMSNSESDSGEVSLDNVTCVVQAGDEDQENQEAYVMVEGSQGPLVFLQSALQQANNTSTQKKTPEPQITPPKPTPVEILEKAKALQKAKAQMSTASSSRRGRKRRGELPPPHELLSSPDFKLFLYSCKMCNFKCNAVKELTAHRSEEHGGSGKWRAGRTAASSLQCARCPYRAHAHAQLMKHVREKHLLEATTVSDHLVYLNSPEAEAADVLVCGACGFESSSRPLFKRHIEEKHSASHAAN